MYIYGNTCINHHLQWLGCLELHAQEMLVFSCRKDSELYSRPSKSSTAESGGRSRDYCPGCTGKESFDKDERWQNLAPPGSNEVVLSRDQLVTSLRTNTVGKK